MTEWTPKLIAQLRELWSDGYSAAQIGHRMGLTKGQVVGKAHRLGLDGRTSPIKRAAPKQEAGAVVVAAQRAASEDALRRRAKKADGIGRHKVATLPPVVAAPPAAAQVAALLAQVRATATPTHVPGQGCRFPLWGDRARATHRYCDKPRRLGAEGTPNSPYCPQCHARTHVSVGVAPGPLAKAPSWLHRSAATILLNGQRKGAA
jgi:hypothetical protein